MKSPIILLLVLLTTALAQQPPACHQIPHTGPCKGRFIRYYYSRRTRSCRSFIWGGCVGRVPFVTLQQCLLARCNNIPRCQRYSWYNRQGPCRVFPDRCQLMPDPGLCRAYIPRYFYNTTTMACEKFVYGGCGGVVPFITQDQCQKSCEDPCIAKPDPGRCRAAFRRYFFNAETKKCESFVWGGCGGTVPFNTLGECQKARCMPDESVEDSPSSELSTPEPEV